MIVYDNGGKTLDRYTIFPFYGSHEFLSCSENGLGVSLWDEITQPFKHHSRSNCLGKRVKFEDLSLELRTHVSNRVLEALKS